MIDYREDNKWTVYVHIIPKAISEYDWDKYYVGITSTSVNQRWHSDGSGYRNGVFMNAINKYGWNNIEHEIIATNLTKDEATDMEKTLIKLLDSKINMRGYNMTDGGEGMSGLVVTEDFRKKCVEAHKKWLEKHPNYKHSDETKIKMKIVQNSPEIKQKKRKNNPKCLEVFMFNSDRIFEKKFISLTEAAEYFIPKNPEKKIRNYLKNYSDSIRTSTINHHLWQDKIWATSEEVIYDDFKDIYILKDSYIVSHAGESKKVFCFDLNKKYVMQF